MTSAYRPFEVVGLVGRMKAGKDTAGNRLVERWGYVRYAFADALKEMCGIVLDAMGIDRTEIGWTGRDWTGPKTDLGRRMLQGVGHGARDTLDPRVWVTVLDRAVQDRAPQYVVVTDVRYPNEARWVLENRGVLVRVERPDVDRSGDEHRDPTEAHVDRIAVSYVLRNDDTVERLHAQVDGLIAGALADGGY